MRLLLPASVGDQIIVHAIHSLPAESVGLLAGKQCRVEMALPLRNIAPQGSFLADPYDQFLAERDIQSRGLDVLAIYHSHPDGCACLSELDLAMATHWNCVQVVIALRTKVKTVQLRAHRLDGTSLTEVELTCPDGQFNPQTFALATEPVDCEKHRAVPL
jgi:[CysO sulfur-carrier protein]-S-L-cysteine hydrolase